VVWGSDSSGSHVCGVLGAGCHRFQAACSVVACCRTSASRSSVHARALPAVTPGPDKRTQLWHIQLCSAMLCSVIVSETRRVPQSTGNHAEGALCAQQAAAAAAAAGKPAEAAKWLVRAVRQLRTARMYDECLTLMAQHPEVADSLGATEVRHTLGHLNAAGVMRCEAEEELLNTTRELCLVPASSASGQGHLQLHSSKGSRLLVDIAAVFRGNKQSPSTRRWTRWRASRSQPR